MPTDHLAGWLGPLAVAVLAGILRFWRLGDPHALVFDETYSAKDALALLRTGVERNFLDDANDRLLAGNPDILTSGAGFVAHPPVGKWVIAAGEAAFGVDPFGWRFSVALLGTLSVLLLARIARRLFRSTVLGVTAGLLLALDGLHFVHSRTALLDLTRMFFALAGFGCLLVDRDRVRERLAAYSPASDGRGLGPGLGWRPWRVLAGVCLGLAGATKWSGIFFLAVFGLLTVLWDRGGRRAAGIRRPTYATLLRDVPGAVVSTVGVAVLVYLSSWAGWFLSDDGYARDWAAQHPDDGPVPGALRSLWHYHDEMWDFNRTLRDSHPYSSNPWSWLLLARPVSFHYEGAERGDAGCVVESCSKAVTALGTPALWWAGLLALPVVLALWAGARDWRAGAALAGMAGGYLPWFAFQGRTIYSFYGVAFVPWLVLAVTLCLGLVVGSATAGSTRRTVGAARAGGYVLVVALNFFWFYPVLAGQVVPYAEWADRMWFRSWI